MRPLIAALLLCAAPLGAHAAEVDRGVYGVWRYEAVSRIAPGGDRRVACTVATGPIDAPRVLLTLASPENVSRDSLFGFSYAEIGPPMGELAIGSALMVEFAAGTARVPGRIVVTETPDGEGARSEVYPASEALQSLLVGMVGAEELRLEMKSDVLRRVPLTGFAEAFAIGAKACGYPNPAGKS